MVSCDLMVEEPKMTVIFARWTLDQDQSGILDTCDIDTSWIGKTIGVFFNVTTNTAGEWTVDGKYIRNGIPVSMRAYVTLMEVNHSRL
jgi:hypothetical protein